MNTQTRSVIKAALIGLAISFAVTAMLMTARYAATSKKAAGERC
jgi:hypothetical protein